MPAHDLIVDLVVRHGFQVVDLHEVRLLNGARAEPERGEDHA